jgi:hypothetical protein
VQVHRLVLAGRARLVPHRTLALRCCETANHRSDRGAQRREKLRIVTFGTGRQKTALERWTNPALTFASYVYM